MVHTQDPTQDHTPDRVIHYAPGSVLGPGDRPLCGNESSTAVYSEDPRQVAGCAEGQQPAGGPSRPSRIGPRWPGLYRQRLRQRLRLTLNYLSAHTCPPRRSARRSALLAAHAPLTRYLLHAPSGAAGRAPPRFSLLVHPQGMGA